MAMAAANKVAAAPTPTRCVVPTARIRKKALAATISAIPMVKVNNARPRRLGLARRIPTQATRVKASTTYSRGTSQLSARVPDPRLRSRYSRGAISSSRPRAKNSTTVTVAMSAATLYWITARRRVVDGFRVEATEVIITQLPAAEAISAT